jgi:aspartyl/asparaginyl-tRNA synthetase
MDDLDKNALKAEKKYNDQYVELTGKLSNIDSSGKYISLNPSDDRFTIIGVMCYIKNDTQSDKVMEMEKGQSVTLKGKIKSVGEVMGYSLDIDEIE